MDERMFDEMNRHRHYDTGEAAGAQTVDSFESFEPFESFESFRPFTT